VRLAGVGAGRGAPPFLRKEQSVGRGPPAGLPLPELLRGSEVAVPGTVRNATSPATRAGLGRGLFWGWGSQVMNSPSSETMLRFGMAPMRRFFSTPPMKRARVGMLMTP
jgi:hypothetical protein